VPVDAFDTYEARNTCQMGEVKDRDGGCQYFPRICFSANLPILHNSPVVSTGCAQKRNAFGLREGQVRCKV